MNSFNLCNSIEACEALARFSPIFMYDSMLFNIAIDNEAMPTAIDTHSRYAAGKFEEPKEVSPVIDDTTIDGIRNRACMTLYMS